MVIKMIIHFNNYIDDDNNNNNNNNNINTQLCFWRHCIVQGGDLTPLAVISLFLMFSIQA
jgi:hypothetical protein